MSTQYYVCNRKTSTVIRAREVLSYPSGIMFGQTVSRGWFSATEAELHRRSIYHDLACLCPEDEHKIGGCLSDLEVLQLSDEEVAAWDQCKADQLGAPLETWRCPACGACIQEDDPHHGNYCSTECEKNHQSDLDAQEEDEI